jgi:hypothetical protein
LIGKQSTVALSDYDTFRIKKPDGALGIIAEPKRSRTSAASLEIVQA